MCRRLSILVMLVLLGVFPPLFSVRVAGDSSLKDVASSLSATEKVSVPHTLIEFHASGTKASDRLDVSSTGGTVSLSGKSIFVTPWNYVKTRWSSGDIWIIFLANVTIDNFYIMYLYLTNSSDSFVVRVFNYDEGTFKMYIFEGTGSVRERVVWTPSVPMPDLEFTPESRNKNILSALGPEIYVTGNLGELRNGTSTLALYPIYNQVYDGADEYNELWALMADDRGNFYYSILYMQNSDPSHVLVGHTIRLNDYAMGDWRQLEAVWTKNGFRAELTVRSGFASALVKVNGFPFQTNRLGAVSVRVPYGTITVEAQGELAISQSTRAKFLKWSDGYSSNPRSVRITGDAELTAVYARQFYLKLDSEIGGVAGQGWYNEGSIASISSQPMIDKGNGERFVFTGWSGNISSSTPSVSVAMNGPRTIVANWKQQYLQQFQLSGLPDGTEVTLTLNDLPQLLVSPEVYSQWVDAGSTVTMSITPEQLTTQGGVLSFAGWKDPSGQTVASSYQVKGPNLMTASYTLKAIQKTAITVVVVSRALLPESSVTIKGSVTPQIPNAQVTLYYSTDKLAWKAIGVATTDSGGAFAYDWSPEARGTIFVKAELQGDANYASSTSEPVSFTNARPTNILSDVSRLFTNPNRGSIPSRSSLNGILATAMAPVLAAVDVGSLVRSSLSFNPALAGLVGYFVASSLIGMIYVFPVAMLSLAVRSARRGAAPSGRALVALLSIWVVGAASVAALELLPASVREPLAVVPMMMFVVSSLLIVPLALAVGILRAAMH